MKIKTAVITGGHEYDLVSFQSLFRSLPKIDSYPQNLWDFVNDTRENNTFYDALLFYNMHTWNPNDESSEYSSLVKRKIEELRTGSTGIFVLHHALVAFPQWPTWGEICGVQKRSHVPGETNQKIYVEIADSNHPITENMHPWNIIDETYVTDDADSSSKILLRTNHSQSMSTIAWTRTYGKARVFCYQNGHDDLAFSNPNFRAVITKGIEWIAKRI